MCSDHLPGQLSVVGFVRVEQAGVSQATERHHPPDGGEADDPGALSLVESAETPERAEESSPSHTGNSSSRIQRFPDPPAFAGHRGPYRQDGAKSKEERCGRVDSHTSVPGTVRHTFLVRFGRREMRRLGLITAGSQRGLVWEVARYEARRPCGHPEPRPRNAAAKDHRQFALGVGPQRQCQNALLLRHEQHVHPGAHDLGRGDAEGAVGGSAGPVMMKLMAAPRPSPVEPTALTVAT